MKQKNNGLAAVQRAALGPYGVWALLFIVVPLIFVAYYAFTDNAFRFTTENMTRFFTARSVHVPFRKAFRYSDLYRHTLQSPGSAHHQRY